jgi:hypothetical protein
MVHVRFTLRDGDRDDPGFADDEFSQWEIHKGICRELIAILGGSWIANPGPAEASIVM